MEGYCAYQERCYKEVEAKLYSFKVLPEEKETIITHLIENNFINEERFAKSFARGKHHYKLWGKTRIKNELKFRGISVRNIQAGLDEITNEIYLENFNTLAEKKWHNINEKNNLKKKKKFVDFLTRKGYESNLIFEKLNELDNNQ